MSLVRRTSVAALAVAGLVLALLPALAPASASSGSRWTAHHPAHAKVRTPHKLTVTVPRHSTGALHLIVTTSGGSSRAEAASAYTYR